jgi:Flp pilus assembly protein TadG
MIHASHRPDLRQRRVITRKSAWRRGATVIEVAMIAPIFFLFVFGLIEYGRVQMISNMMNASCRSAARLGSTEGVSTADVQARVRQMMASCVAAQHLTVEVKDASVYDGTGTLPQSETDFSAMPNLEVDDALSRQMFLVRASVAYNDIAMVPMPVLEGVTLRGKVFMRHE